MNKIVLKIMCIATVVMNLVSCTQPEPTRESSVTTTVYLYNNRNELIFQSTDPTYVQKVAATLNERKETLVKILPIFSHKIVVQNGSNKEAWLINTAGYLKSETGSQEKLFTVSHPEPLLTMPN